MAKQTNRRKSDTRRPRSKVSARRQSSKRRTASDRKKDGGRPTAGQGKTGSASRSAAAERKPASKPKSGSGRGQSSRGTSPTGRKRQDSAGAEGIGMDREKTPIEMFVEPARLENSDAPGSDAEVARRQAASMAGDEEPGGSVTVPEHDSVDEWAGALGVERSPSAPVRGSAEILDARDRRRVPGGPSPDKQRRSI